jgi:hypothetical protein
VSGVRPWPDDPLLFEIYTWVWLAGLSTAYGRQVTLADVPDEVWDDVARPGVDAVWLMGVWERSPMGAAIARSNDAMRTAQSEALPDVTDADVVGSAYCVRAYTCDPALGGDAGLAVARAALANRGVRLVLDLVPNHVAPDHAWVVDHPEYFVHGSAEDAQRDPASFIEIGNTVFACGRDPYFPAWPEVLQLDGSHPALRAAMAAQVADLVTKCDALRCDMAMLLLDDVFHRTWGDRASGGEHPAGPGFWPTVFAAGRAANPEARFWAEAYWDLEPVLVAQGFDACYDKRLYDRLVHHASASELRAHLSASLEWQRHTVRFVENHDEPRAASLVSDDRHLAMLAAVCTLPGVALLHEGETEGRRVRVPVTLGRRPVEAVDPVLRAGVDRLLAAVAGGVRDGVWQLLSVDGWPDNRSADQLLAWSRTGEERHVVVVNLSGQAADGRVRVPWDDLRGRVCTFDDVLHDVRYERDGDAVADDGLYVALEPDHVHLFRVSWARSDSDSQLLTNMV